MNTDEIQELKGFPLRVDLRKCQIKEEQQLNGYQLALQKHYKQIAYDYIQDNLHDYEFTLFPKINKFYKEKYIPNRKNCKHRYKFAMITVNPRSDITLDQLTKCYDKAMRKKYIMSSVSCYEWTSDETSTTNGGLHIHMRIEIHNKDPYRIKREFYNTFKHITEPQCVSILYSNNTDSFIQYINGKEKDGDLYVDKKCMPYTLKYRESYNVPSTF